MIRDTLAFLGSVFAAWLILAVLYPQGAAFLLFPLLTLLGGK